MTLLLHVDGDRCPICAGGRIKSVGDCSVCGLHELHLRDDGALICGACGFDTRDRLNTSNDVACPGCGRRIQVAVCGCRVCPYCDFADRCARPRGA